MKSTQKGSKGRDPEYSTLYSQSPQPGPALAHGKPVSQKTSISQLTETLEEGS